MPRVLAVLVASIFLAVPAVAIGASRSAPSAHAAPMTYRLACDPVLWSEHMPILLTVRPHRCGYWGEDRNGPMADVVRFDHLRWSSWGHTAVGHGMTVPNHRGQGERPIAITVHLSNPVLTCNATTSFYSTVKIRTRYGTDRFDARSPDRCVAPDPGALRAYDTYGDQVAAPITCPAGTALVADESNAYCDIPGREPGSPVAMPASVGPCPEPDFYRYIGNGDANYCAYVGPVVSFD